MMNFLEELAVYMVGRKHVHQIHSLGDFAAPLLAAGHSGPAALSAYMAVSSSLQAGRDNGECISEVGQSFVPASGKGLGRIASRAFLDKRGPKLYKRRLLEILCNQGNRWK
jgi:hypothetical protein